MSNSARALLAGVLLIAASCSDGPSADPDPNTDNGEIPGEMESVAADVQRMAPALEGYSFQNGYAETLDEAIQLLEDADLATTEPNVVGGYEYDPEAEEFVLCIEDPDGAFASFDTQPMVVFTTGASGGCPKG